MKKIYGLVAAFDTTPDLYHACEKVRDAGYSQWDAITSFPIHGLDAAMGMRRSKVPRFSLAGGLIATTANPTSFTVLFLIDAVTFLAFVFALYFVPEPVALHEPTAENAGYREVLRHGVFVAFVA